MLKYEVLILKSTILLFHDKIYCRHGVRHGRTIHISIIHQITNEYKFGKLISSKNVC